MKRKIPWHDGRDDTGGFPSYQTDLVSWNRGDFSIQFVDGLRCPGHALCRTGDIQRQRIADGFAHVQRLE
ncbi:hypothetical protein D3C84_1012780 [compost metagenome]